MAEEKDLLQKVNEETAKAIESFKNEYKEIATKAAEGKISKEDVDKQLSELEKKSKDFTSEELKKLSDELSVVQEELKEAQLKIKRFEDNGLSNNANYEKKGIGTLLRKSLEKDGLLEEYVVDSVNGRKAVMMKGWDKKDTRHSVKAAIDMTTALTLTPGVTTGTNIGYLTDYKMRDVQISLTKDVHMVQVLPTDPIMDKYMGVLVEYEYTDGSGTKDEAIASGKSSIKFKTIEYKVFTIATHFRVSKENLADIDRLESKLNRIAPDKILSTFDNKILSATGDNSTDVQGMYADGNFTAFNASEFAESVENANYIDLIRKMKLQAHNDDQDVNTVILHPTIIDEIESLKGSDRNYLQSRGIIFDNEGNLIRVHGLFVVKNKKQTVDRVTVMWNEAAEIGIREDINFEVGLDGNDLTEGMRTIVFEMRAAFGVGKPNAIIVSSDPATDIAALNIAIA